MMNKKGAEMAIGTIVVIILALVVLVVIIYGFSKGWGNLWQSMVGYGGGDVNVQSNVDSCKLACTTQSIFDYCTKKRSVTFQDTLDKKTKTIEITCEELKRGGTYPTIKPSGQSATIGSNEFDCDLNCNPAVPLKCETDIRDRECKLPDGSLNPKCDVKWMTPVLLIEYNAAKGIGPGKYGVVDVMEVTDSNDITLHKDQKCVKLIMN